MGFNLPDQESNLYPCIGRRSLNHWASREVPIKIYIYIYIYKLNTAQEKGFDYKGIRQLVSEYD